MLGGVGEGLAGSEANDCRSQLLDYVDSLCARNDDVIMTSFLSCCAGHSYLIMLIHYVQGMMM